MNFSFADILDKLKNKEHFSFSRWGDGEWIAVTGIRSLDKNGGLRSNCDGHKYFGSLRVALEEVLMDSPKYYMGFQPLARRVMGDKIDEWLAQRNINIDWCNTEYFHNASQKGVFFEPFMESIKDRDVLLVGNESLSKLGFDMVTVPQVNCWKDRDRIVDEIGSKMKDVVLFCSGMPSNVWIHQLHNENVTLIDMGSVFDPYCGRNTRSYHHKLEVN